MATDGTRPDEDLHGVDVAFTILSETVAPMSDDDARGPTLLPGWTRGHVLTHLARNADGQRRMIEGAVRGEVLEQYPGGDAQRVADIDSGAGRPAAVLLADLHSSQELLVAAWGTVPDGAWDRLTAARAGVRPVRDGVLSRWREILVHLVDLDAGFPARGLPADYLARDEAWLRELRPETWPDVPW